VTFVTWKCHSPTDPDEVPESERVGLTPADRFSGYVVRLERDPANFKSGGDCNARIRAPATSSSLVRHRHARIYRALGQYLIEEKCKTGKKMAENNRDYPHSVKLTILFEMGLLERKSLKS